LCKDPETILPVPYLSREIERFAAISILDWHRKNVGWRDKSANANRGGKGEGEGGGGYGRRIRNRPARRANLLCGRRRIALTETAGASNNPRAFSNATWGTGRPPTA